VRNTVASYPPGYHANHTRYRTSNAEIAIKEKYWPELSQWMRDDQFDPIGWYSTSWTTDNTPFEDYTSIMIYPSVMIYDKNAPKTFFPITKKIDTAGRAVEYDDMIWPGGGEQGKGLGVPTDSDIAAVARLYPRFSSLLQRELLSPQQEEVERSPRTTRRRHLWHPLLQASRLKVG
jgi:hypothetical protein